VILTNSKSIKMHNLNFNNDTRKYSFISAKEPAWHHLGQILDHVFTAKEAIEFRGLDFTLDLGATGLNQKNNLIP
jgi:hypothetical protein